MTLTTIDLASLTSVTGGCRCMMSQQMGSAPTGAAPDPSAGPSAGAAPGLQDPSAGAGAAPTGGGGGNLVSIIRGILGFLQSPQFAHIVNGSSEFLSAFAGDGSQAQPTTQA